MQGDATGSDDLEVFFLELLMKVEIFKWKGSGFGSQNVASVVVAGWEVFVVEIVTLGWNGQVVQ